MDSISLARLQDVHPKLREKIERMAVILEAEQLEFRVVQAFRTWAEQETLYAQGRTAPGEIVTRCRGGYSWHNFGLAVDCVPSKFPPGQPYAPDWRNDHPDWKRMEAVGQTLGLEVGAMWRTFPDAPHFQLHHPFPVSPDEHVRQLFQSSGLQAIWDAVEV